MMSSIALRLWITSTLVVACAPKRDGSRSPVAPQSERVQRLQQSMGDLQDTTVRAFLNQMDRRMIRLLFDDRWDETHRVRNESLSFWVQKLRSGVCEGRSALPVSASQVPESGYFYFIVDSRQCPIHLESRLQVIRTTKGSDTNVVMTLRYTLEVNDPEMSKQFEIRSYSVDGDIHVRKVEQGFEVSGYAYGSIRPLTPDPIALMIQFRGNVQRNRESQIIRKSRLDFKDFSAELDGVSSFRLN